MLVLRAVIVAAVVYVGWGKPQEALVNRAIVQKLAEARGKVTNPWRQDVA